MALETIGIWVWKHYEKHILEKMAKVVTNQWQKFQWNDAAAKYRERLREQHSNIHVLGHVQPMTLDEIFSEAYILDKPTAFYRYNIEQLQNESAKSATLAIPAERKNALRIAVEKERLFILGKPGAGKTTFLNYLTLKAVEGKLHFIPIFVPLKELADTNLELMPFIVDQFEICGFPDAQPFIEYILNDGKAIVLFDGLDEVNLENEQRAHIIADIDRFVNHYPKNHYAITCRNAATDYSFYRFTYVEMADFDDNQIHVFAKKWFNKSFTKYKKFLEELYKSEHEGLQELARTPLLLILLCVAFDETMAFPQRRAELYKEALDALLIKWDSSRNIKRDVIYRQLSPMRKRQMFSRIAAETFDAGTYFFHEEDLARKIVDYLARLPAVESEGDIDGVAILRAIAAQHGIFVERAHKIYSFSHLTFQEYFTANYILDNASNGALKRLLARHLVDNRWREVFLLTTSLLDDASYFFELFMTEITQLISADKQLIGMLEEVGEFSTTAFKRAMDLAVLLIRNIHLKVNRGISHTEEIINANVNELSYAKVRSKDLTRYSTVADKLFQDIVRARDIAFVAGNLLVLAGELKDSNNPLYDFAKANITEFIQRVEDSFKAAQALSLNLTHARERARSGDIRRKHSQDLDRTMKVEQDLLGNLSIAQTLSKAITIGQISNKDEWMPEKTQVTKLHEYVNASRFLLECLSLSYVPDRNEIRNRLLTLPRE